MEEFKDLLETRKKKLQQIKKNKEKTLKKVPEGYLRICKSGNKTQFYHRTNPKDFNGKYIRSEEVEFAKKLAQKDYDSHVLKAAEKEIYAIDKYLSYVPNNVAEEIYETLHPERQKLVIPITLTDEKYVENWLSEEYERKSFYEDLPELYTANRERVRSKSEIIIADTLLREGIPYKYEKPLYLNTYGKIHPDFTVLNVRTREDFYWEHLGMMDDPQYVESALKKIEAYERSGFFLGEKLILTFESKRNPISQKVVNLLIENYLR